MTTTGGALIFALRECVLSGVEQRLGLLLGILPRHLVGRIALEGGCFTGGGSEVRLGEQRAAVHVVADGPAAQGQTWKGDLECAD